MIKNRLNATLATTLLASACLGWAGLASATTKAEYNAAKSRNSDTYKSSSAQCKSLASNAKDVCQAEAKAAQTKSDAMAEADYKNTPKARADAASTSADADYDVAKQRCGAKTGNDKDVCVKEAEAVRTRAKADATAGRKSAEARKDASDDTRDANYKVAMEKCDGFAGDTKDTCQKSAKAQYGK